MLVKWSPVRGTSIVVANFKLGLCDTIICSLKLKCPVSPGIFKHTRIDVFPTMFPKVIAYHNSKLFFILLYIY